MSVTATAILHSLSPEEESDRRRLERKVKSNLHEQGMALLRLREHKLYRSTHTSWKDYLWDCFQMSKSFANRLIRAAQFIEDVAGYFLDKLVPSGHHSEGSKPSSMRCVEEVLGAEPVPSGHQSPLVLLEELPDVVLPTQEKPLRCALDLPPEQRGRAWEIGLELNEGRPPSSAQMAQAVLQLERQFQETGEPPENPFIVGQVCLVRPQNHPELRGLGGAPGIVIQRNEFSCQVRTGLGDRLVPCQNLEALEIDPWDAEAMRERIERLYQLSQKTERLDPVAHNAVLQLSRLASAEWTSFQEALLSLLEQQYGLNAGDEEAAAPPTTQNPALAPLRTSPPDWAQEELEVAGAGSSQQHPAHIEPPLEPPGAQFFARGEAIRVGNANPQYHGLTGKVVRVGARRITVKLDGVRKNVELLPREVEKLGVPPEPQPRGQNPQQRRSRDRGSG